MEIKSRKRDETLLAIKNLGGRKSAEECKKLESYLGSPYKVLGLSRADYDSVIRDYAKKEGKKISSADLNTLADSLWTNGKTFEERTIAIALLERFPKLLDKETWSMVDRWFNFSRLKTGEIVTAEKKRRNGLVEPSPRSLISCSNIISHMSLLITPFEYALFQTNMISDPLSEISWSLT